MSLSFLFSLLSTRIPSRSRSMIAVAFSLFALVAASPCARGAYLVKDINATTAESPSSSAPTNFFRHGSRIYFSAGSNDTGVELWSTDGTEAGTALVADIHPGNASSLPSRFTVLNGQLIFNARDSRGEELWMTDGTAEGTRVMADINSGARSSSPSDRIVFNGKMIFAAADGVNGRELWITDGTPAGTRFFKDLAPGPIDSSPRSFVLLNGTIYFGAADALWKSDGTEAGTVVVKSGLYAGDLVAAGSRIVFDGYEAGFGTEPWVSDGTEAGTHRLADITPGNEGSVTHTSAFAFGDIVLFSAYDKEHGLEPWITDGTEGGTRMLRDIFPGPESSVPYGAVFTILGQRAFFAVVTPEHGVQLWQTDGTSAGTSLTIDVIPGHVGSLRDLVAVGESLYFVSADSVGTRIWVTDGTAAGTRSVTTPDLQLSVGSPLTNVDGTLYFPGANRLNGFEPWKSDGTAAGTSMIANVAADAPPSSDPSRFLVAGDWLYFIAWNGLAWKDGQQVSTFWRTDGTPEGTLEVSPLIPWESNAALAVGRRLFFHSGLWDDPLWVTDGTPEGTKSAAELAKRFPEMPWLRFVLGDRILAASDDRLWSTTAAFGAPAVLLGKGAPSSMTELAGRVLFLADNDAGSSEFSLRITDGTPAGTYVVRSFEEWQGTLLGVMSGQAYFVTSDNNHTDVKLWKSDGTVDGTVVVASVPSAYGAVAAGERLFFRAGEGGPLWVTDGTAEGTRALPANPLSNLAAIGDAVVFTASDAATGNEPWISDGTPEGTRLLLDIYPGQYGFVGPSITSAGNVAYFSATSPGTGSELWMTDGTSAGTLLAADIEPGNGSSYPGELKRAGERVFFLGRTRATGRELWAEPLPPAPRVVLGAARVTEGDSGTTNARFTATLTSPSAQTATVEYTTSDGTAVASADYDAASGTLTFAPGETTKTFDVVVRGDGVTEGNETFLVRLRQPAGATIETSVAAGIIDDDDRAADVGLVFDFSSWSAVLLDVTNDGPATATNLQARMTAVPVNTEPGPCYSCPFLQLAPNERTRALAYGEPFDQQYLTATVTARESDPDPSNNRVAWTTNGSLAMDALHLTPGSDATVWVRLFSPVASFSVESSDPSIVTVPANVTGATSFAVHGVSIGTATIRVFTPEATLGTIAIDVLAPGTRQRFSNAMKFYPKDYQVRFDVATAINISGIGSAPFTGARPTGTLILTANEREVTRVQLAGDASRVEVPYHLPDIGSNAISLSYSGDENFLPQTSSWEIRASPGYTTIHATATRHGTNVIVRARVSGSPMASPTGTIGVYGTTADLTAIGPGLSHAELTLQNIGPETQTLTIRYSGGAHYLGNAQDVVISDAKRRTSRH